MLPVRNVNFNQDYSCFTCAMDDGLRIYNIEPLTEKFRLDLDKVGSISKVFMLHRTNLIGVVAGGPKPKFPSNVLMIWDDKLREFVIQYVFSSDILNVYMCRDKLIVVLKNCAYVYSFPTNSKKLMELDTRSNPLGVCEVRTTIDRQILAVLGHKIGSIQLMDLSLTGKSGSSSKTGSSSPAPITINAHQTDIVCIALNQQASIVATASEKGTLIRLFDVLNRQKLAEMRRGSDQAVLHCINFSRDSSYLCAASDKGTVHIFALKDTALNRRSAFAKAGKVGAFQQYTNSQWSFCNFTVPAECPCICSFGSGNSVYAICNDGTYHKYHFTAEGSCKREAYDVYLEVGDEEDF